MLLHPEGDVDRPKSRDCAVGVALLPSLLRQHALYSEYQMTFRQEVGPSFTSVPMSAEKDRPGFPCPSVLQDLPDRFPAFPVIPSSLRRGGVMPRREPRPRSFSTIAQDLLALPPGLRASSGCPCWRSPSASRGSPSPRSPQDEISAAVRVISILPPPSDVAEAFCCRATYSPRNHYTPPGRAKRRIDVALIYNERSNIRRDSKGGVRCGTSCWGGRACGLGAVALDDDVRRGVGLGGVERGEPQDFRRVPRRRRELRRHREPIPRGTSEKS